MLPLFDDDLPGAVDAHPSAPGTRLPARPEGTGLALSSAAGRKQAPGLPAADMTAASPFNRASGDAATEPALSLAPVRDEAEGGATGDTPVPPKRRAPGGHSGTTALPGHPSSPASEARPVAAAEAAPRIWVVELPAGLTLLSLNDRLHWAARNRTAQALKDAAIVMTRAAKVPRLERITVKVLYDPPDRRHRDADNLAATLKPLLDGIATAILPSYGGKRRVVPGDDSRHVASVSLAIGPAPYPRGRVRIVITEVAGGAP